MNLTPRPGSIATLRRPLIVSAALMLNVLLSGCATPISETEANGPTAMVRDTGFSESGTRAQFFMMAGVDERSIETSQEYSRKVSAGRGNQLRTVLVERMIPARRMRVKLVAAVAVGMPITGFINQLRGQTMGVEGVVDFEPQPGKIYLVKGSMTDQKSQIWIEDEASAKPVTKVVSTEANR